MDAMIKDNFTEDQVAFITVLDDLGQPHTCDSWGNHGELNYPYIIDDGQTPVIYQLFYPNTNIDYPKNVLIDHNMEVKYKLEGYSEDLLLFYLQELVNNI